MTIDNGGRELAQRLTAAFDQVSPSPAPVAAVLRRGQAMRHRRRLAMTAGVAAAVSAVAVVAAVVAAPRLHDRNARPGPVSSGHGSSLLTRHGGVIASGTISGRAWRIVADRADDRLCAGVAGLRRSCVNLRGQEHLSGLTSLSGMVVRVPHSVVSFGPPIWNCIFGTVGSGVTRVALAMSNGSTVNLRPVAAVGYRWVGLVSQAVGAVVVRATAYSGRTELAYSVPFIGGVLRPGTYFVSWLPPGQAGPVQRSADIGSGGSGGHAWDALVLAGPWGYCVSQDVPVDNGGQQNCWDPAELAARAEVIMHRGLPPTVPRWIVGTATPAVSYLRLTMTNGHTVRVSVVAVSGQKFYAMAVSKGPGIVRWGAFDADGHWLYGGGGAPDAGS